MSSRPVITLDESLRSLYEEAGVHMNPSKKYSIRVSVKYQDTEKKILVLEARAFSSVDNHLYWRWFVIATVSGCVSSTHYGGAIPHNYPVRNHHYYDVILAENKLILLLKDEHGHNMKSELFEIGDYPPVKIPS